VNALPQWLPYKPEDVQNVLRVHPSDSEGFVTLCNKTTRWNEINIRPSDLEYVLRTFPKVDSYLTQNRFSVKKRLTATLQELNALWVDIDFYKTPGLEDKHFGYVLDLALFEIHRNRIPEPSLAISSGRGLYLIWLLKPEPIKRLGEWQKLQNHLTSILSDLGGDFQSRPATQVLRIVGSENSKNGQPVQVIHSGNDYRWTLNELLYEIDIPEPKQAKIESIELLASKQKKKSVSKIFVPKFFTQKTLWSLRYQEIRTLLDYRFPQGIPNGSRDTWLFISSVALSWLLEDVQSIEKEIKYLAKRCLGKFTDSDIQSTYKQSIHRLKRSQSGGKIVWNGIEKDPRYHFKTTTIVESLGITTEEARTLGLRGLIPTEYRKELESERLHKIRNCTNVRLYRRGYTSREDSYSRLKPWEEEGISRRTWYYRRKSERETPIERASNE
jgi:hypothetical protein